jgi:hypothetical protein
MSLSIVKLTSSSIVSTLQRAIVFTDSSFCRTMHPLFCVCRWPRVPCSNYCHRASQLWSTRSQSAIVGKYVIGTFLLDANVFTVVLTAPIEKGVICTATLAESHVAQFEEAIKSIYWFEFFVGTSF